VVSLWANASPVILLARVGPVDAHTFRISAPLYLDYLVSKKARARLAFPVVGGWNVQDVTVEGLIVEGQRASS
jgi:hypothetical protein